MSKHWFRSHLVKRFTKGKALGLDIGSGYGNWNEFKECEFINLDILKNDQITINADLNQILPFKNNTFDIVICYSVLEYITNDLLLLQEIYRILKTNGIFIVSTQNKIYPQSRLDEALEIIGFNMLFHKYLKEWVWSIWFNLTSVYTHQIVSKRQDFI